VTSARQNLPFWVVCDHDRCSNHGSILKLS
jgi:hypothetical protein